jgi:hypothetical protein
VAACPHGNYRANGEAYFISFDRESSNRGHQQGEPQSSCLYLHMQCHQLNERAVFVLFKSKGIVNYTSICSRLYEQAEHVHRYFSCDLDKVDDRGLKFLEAWLDDYILGYLT